MRHFQYRFYVLFILILLLGWGIGQTSMAQQNPFEAGWHLLPEDSSLNFQSVKKQTKVETSSFATFSGKIDPAGKAEIRIQLESVDTKVDLRNVRMRFLFFESFLYPEAVVTLQLDPSQFSDMKKVRHKVVPLSYTLDLHGVSKTFETIAVATLLGPNKIAVSTQSPISVAAADFDLMSGIEKLEEAAGVKIIPSAAVTFDFVFRRNGTKAGKNKNGTKKPAKETDQTARKSAALEPEGDMDDIACKGRFEILSRTSKVFFGSGSTRLTSKSSPFLDSLVDIIERCPSIRIEVSGHTDSDGAAKANKLLSKARAQAVVEYLIKHGIAADRLISVGFGEVYPAFQNNSAKNKKRNRRIEFTIIEG